MCLINILSIIGISIVVLSLLMIILFFIYIKKGEDEFSKDGTSEDKEK